MFEYNGPSCYIKAFKNYVNIGFWRGTEIISGKGILESGGEKMAHFRVSTDADINKKLIRTWAGEAIKLNQIKGDPTKKKRKSS